MTTAWLTKVRVKPWRLAYYRSAFLAARDDDPELTMAMWIRSAMDTQAMAQFGDTQVPQPEHLFFDKASRRRRGEEIEAIPAEADTFDELFGEGKD